MRRDRKETMLRILQLLAKENLSKTKIVYSLMLNFQATKTHLDYLVGKEYVNYDASTRRYSITGMGMQAMQIAEVYEKEWTQ